MSLKGALADVGIAAESINRIRLGPGVVGRTTWVGLGALIVLGVAAWNTKNEWLLGGIVGAVLVVSLTYLFRVTSYAKEHPGPALLEGAELLQWQQVELAAKGLTPPKSEGLVVQGQGRE